MRFTLYQQTFLIYAAALKNNKKCADLVTFFHGFSKFYKNQNILESQFVSSTKMLGPISLTFFYVYWMQTERQTRQTSKVYIDVIQGEP